MHRFVHFIKHQNIEPFTKENVSCYNSVLVQLKEIHS